MELCKLSSRELDNLLLLYLTDSKDLQDKWISLII